MGVARTSSHPRVLLVAPKGEADELQTLLQRVGCALERWTGRPSLARIAAHYALIVLALGLLPDDVGAWCDQIRRTSPTTHVVLFAEREGVAPLLGDHAHELILSDEPPAVVEWRLERAILVCKGPVLRWGPIAVDTENQVVALSGGRRHPDLTPTEYRLLVLLIERAGALVSIDEIVHVALQVSAATNPRVHVSHLRRKLGSVGALIKSKRGAGYFMARV